MRSTLSPGRDQLGHEQILDSDSLTGVGSGGRPQRDEWGVTLVQVAGFALV